MHNTEQTRTTETNHRSEEMSCNQDNAGIKSAPLYASPWLAFFYLIRRGLGQLLP